MVEFFHDHCHAEDVNQETAVAAAYEHFDIVKFVLEKNPRLLIDFYDSDNDPFVEAARCGHQEIVEFLYNNECISSKSILEAFMSASKWGHQAIVEFLHGKGCISS